MCSVFHLYNSKNCCTSNVLKIPCSSHHLQSFDLPFSHCHSILLPCGSGCSSVEQLPSSSFLWRVVEDSWLCYWARVASGFQNSILKLWKIFLSPSNSQIIWKAFSCMLCRRPKATSKWGCTGFPHFPSSLEQKKCVSKAKLKQYHIESDYISVCNLCRRSFIIHSSSALQRNVEWKSFLWQCILTLVSLPLHFFLTLTGRLPV